LRYVYIGLIVAFTTSVLLFKFQNPEAGTVSLFSASMTLSASTLAMLICVLGMLTGGSLFARMRACFDVPGEPLESVIRLPGRAVRAMLTRWVVVCAVAGLAGCSTLPRNALPTELMGEAGIPGMPDVRAPAGRLSVAMSQDLARSFKQESPDEFPLGPDGAVHYAHLALSGGGANGAYGAGFLNGWTKTGKRPVFKIVTGVSTGALMALLGPAYDGALREFYTTTASRNIFRVLSFIPQLLGGESFADSAPLRALIERHVNAEFLGQIAQAQAAGRRLYVGTVDLDSQRLVIWNMGLIAASGRPEALALFRQVMLTGLDTIIFRRCSSRSRQAAALR
jgi:hypothetical protein